MNLRDVLSPITAGEQDHWSWNRDHTVFQVAVTPLPHQMWLVTTTLQNNTRPDRFLVENSLYRTMPDRVTLRVSPVTEAVDFQLYPNEAI